MEKATAEGVAFKENPAAVYAAVRNILYDGGKKIEILALWFLLFLVKLYNR